MSWSKSHSAYIFLHASMLLYISEFGCHKHIPSEIGGSLRVCFSLQLKNTCKDYFSVDSFSNYQLLLSVGFINTDQNVKCHFE